ncbi:MAG: BrnA antitoxin family protein [Ruminococcus sp.]|nr:BrnA antitoxin family protein [Ruminococcus sp.]
MILTSLTDEQKKILEELKTRPVTLDDECPELTAEQLKQFARVSEKNREERRKQTVTLRLSPQAVRTAKSLGNGYTSVLSRILENALTDAELIKHYL